MPSREFACLLVDAELFWIGTDRILDILVVVTGWGEGDAATKSATWKRKKRQNAQEKQQNRSPRAG